ncbi:hypothetical protein [Paenibacillus wenxiniae]|uniref:Uncharacterized protein n=1 Tax=Paenibacillus wenxiniae TaxID=1636843 RepID=A0ABW4RN91_9BACL
MNKTSKLLMSITLTGAALATPWALQTNNVSAAASTTHKQTIAAASKQNNNPYEVAGISSANAFHQFFFNFQQAVMKGNKAAVASRVHYPLNVNANGKTYTIKNAKSFIAKYDFIMTPEVKRTLAYAIEEDLFVNWKGVMVGNGELWFSQSNGKLGLDAVNR